MCRISRHPTDSITRLCNKQCLKSKALLCFELSFVRNLTVEQGENHGDSADLKRLDIPEKSTIEVLFQDWHPISINMNVQVLRFWLPKLGGFVAVLCCLDSLLAIPAAHVLFSTLL